MQSESCDFFATLQRQRPLNIGDCIIIGGQRYPLIEYTRTPSERATEQSKNNLFSEKLVFCKEGFFLNTFVVSFFHTTRHPDLQEKKRVSMYRTLNWKSKLIIAGAITGALFYYKDSLACTVQ
jgi:hypothetical protein